MQDDAPQGAEPRRGATDHDGGVPAPADGDPAPPPAAEPPAAGPDEAAAVPEEADEAAAGAPGAVATGRRRGTRPSRRAVTLVAIPIVAFIVATNVGDAMAPTLVDTHPLWLTALTSRNRHLVLVTNQLDAFSYYTVASLRLIASDPLFFLLGWWYGDAAITWMEKRTRTWGQSFRQAEGWFSKAAYPIVFAAPNQYVCLLAGAAGMSVPGFFVVNIAGTFFRLYLVRRFGEAFDGPIDGVVEWIGDNRLPLLGVTIAITVVTLLLEAKRGETEVASMARLDEELEEAADETEARRHPGPGPAAGPDRSSGPGPDKD
jgi:membrane protein DedA with SNARE-associated domain